MSRDGEYFNELQIARSVVSWAEAVELQLDRWEGLVAQCPVVWRAQFERHFRLIAAAHLLRGLRLAGSPLPLENVMASEIREARDLQEHREENMPVFLQRPRVEAPRYRSGRDFADRSSLPT